MTQPIKRRELLTGLGIGTLLTLSLPDREARASDDADLWKYAAIDPQKAADLAYEIYPGGACMYAAVRAILVTVADAVDPLTASMMRGFPFHIMKYGHGGIGATGSTCGAFNGGAAVIGLFVNDATKRDAMIQELAAYYERTELPEYRPKDDKFSAMPTVVPGSLLCHVSSSRWRTAADAVADTKMFSSKRADRCRRLTADVVIKTVELLNRYHTDKTCTFTLLVQPTATCYDCHGPKGTQADIIGTANCTTCHQHDDSHSNKHINKK